MSKKASDNCRLMRAVAPWFNAIADAWGAGQAPWAYVEGRSAAGALEGGVEAANRAVINLAKANGVTP